MTDKIILTGTIIAILITGAVIGAAIALTVSKKRYEEIIEKLNQDNIAECFRAYSSGIADARNALMRQPQGPYLKAAMSYKPRGMR